MLGIPFVAFGGGEPLGVAHCWDVFERLAAGGVALKLETDGSRIDAAAADRIAALAVDCVQISVDGATAATHQRVRPGSSFAAAIGAIERLVARGLRAAVRLRPDTTQPCRDRRRLRSRRRARLQRLRHRSADAHRSRRRGLGHARLHRRRMAARGRCAARARGRERARGPALSIYPWDIVTEMETRLESPQAMLLVVPNGKVKLLNALPFAPADLRRDSLRDAWHAYRAAWRTTRGSRLRACAAAASRRCCATPTRRGQSSRTTDEDSDNPRLLVPRGAGRRG